MEETIKPCPFCGGTDIRDTAAPGHYSVACGCFRGGFETRMAALDNWNRRVEEAARQPAKEEAEA